MRINLLSEIDDYSTIVKDLVLDGLQLFSPNHFRIALEYSDSKEKIAGQFSLRLWISGEFGQVVIPLNNELPMSQIPDFLLHSNQLKKWGRRKYTDSWDSFVIEVMGAAVTQFAKPRVILKHEGCQVVVILQISTFESRGAIALEETLNLLRVKY